MTTYLSHVAEYGDSWWSRRDHLWRRINWLLCRRLVTKVSGLFPLLESKLLRRQNHWLSGPSYFAGRLARADPNLQVLIIEAGSNNYNDPWVYRVSRKREGRAGSKMLQPLNRVQTNFSLSLFLFSQTFKSLIRFLKTFPSRPSSNTISRWNPKRWRSTEPNLRSIYLVVELLFQSQTSWEVDLLSTSWCTPEHRLLIGTTLTLRGGERSNFFPTCATSRTIKDLVRTQRFMELEEKSLPVLEVESLL